MGAFGARTGRPFLAAAIAAAVCAAAAGGAAAKLQVKRVWMPAPTAPATPSSITLKGVHLKHGLNLNQVGVIKIGSKNAKNVLVFEPGTSAGAAYIVPFAKSLVEKLPGWQVWSVERRENLLEDQTLHREGQARHRDAAGTVPLLPRLPDRTPSKAPHMRLRQPGRSRLRQELGHERRRRRPAHGDRGSESARWQGRARGPLARRVGRHRLRDLGLRGLTRAPTASPVSSTTTAAAARPRSRKHRPKNR